MQRILYGFIFVLVSALNYASDYKLKQPINTVPVFAVNNLMQHHNALADEKRVLPLR